MSGKEFESLEDVYPQVIAHMPDKFDSHEFILKLAQEHQRLYVQALVEYVENDMPFKIVHGQIAQRLLKYPELVTSIGKHTSRDIFRQNNSAEMWQKVGK